MPIFCPQCGTKLQYTEAEICPSCGIRLTNSRINNTNERYIKRIFFTVFGILLVLIFITMISPLPGEKNTPVPPEICPMKPDNHESVTPREWVWHRDGWGDWEYASSWTSPQNELQAEYGPVTSADHGEYGTDVHLNSGSTESHIWKIFTDPTGIGWNTVTFDGDLSASDYPSGRWVKLEVIGENGNGEIRRTAEQTPPGNGERFTMQCHFPTSHNVTVKISHGQNPAWGIRFMMKYYSLKLDTE